MRRSTRWMLAYFYYSSQIFAIFPFGYDFERREIYTSPTLTIYSTIFNICLVGYVPLLWSVEINPENMYDKDLHVVITAISSVVNILAVLITAMLVWLRRREFMKVLQEFLELRLRIFSNWPCNEHLQAKYENAIRSKFFWCISAHICVVFGYVEFYRQQFKIDGMLLFVGIMIYNIYMEIILTNSYVFLVNVNILLEVLNGELNKILECSALLSHFEYLKEAHRSDFEDQCRKLAAELDVVAKFQYQLQQIVNRMTQLCGVQMVSDMLMIYLGNVGTIYMTYMMIQHSYMREMYQASLPPTLISLFVYYMDLRQFAFSVFDLEERFEEPGQILRLREMSEANLNDTLENSVSMKIFRKKKK